MEADLIIRYKHDVDHNKEHVCTGEMFYRHSDGSLPPHGHWEFEKEHFKKLLIEAANRLNKDDRYHIEKVVIERTDRQGLKPIILDHPTQEILKADPALAIRLLNYEGPAVFSGGKKIEQKPLPPLVSGYDTLAEALGEDIYIRQHKGLVECPGCGLWSTGNNPFTCKKKCKISLPVTYTEQWAKVKTIDLLNLNLPKYFIPRGFNKTKPWISNSDLKGLYEAWRAIAQSNIDLTKENVS